MCRAPFTIHNQPLQLIRSLQVGLTYGKNIRVQKNGTYILQNMNDLKMNGNQAA